MALSSLLRRLSDELRRRGVVKVVVSYAVVAFVLLQVAEITFDPLGLPDWSLAAAVVISIAGFPVVAIVAWVFDLGPSGVVRTGESGTDGAEVTAAEPASTARVPSVAILPFEDLSPEHDQEFFCDGIAEEILGRLVQIKQLRVASRTSSFQFKAQPIDVGEIARRLKVDAVLERSVRKSGDRLRVTTQLFNAADGYHLWSESFDRELEDIFDIQEEIAANVARALEVTLAASAFEAFATKDVRAYEFYLKGGHYFRRWGQRNVEFAAEMFERAVETDPTYALAWAALADSHAMICMYWDQEEHRVEATDRASLEALALAPALAEAHVSRGMYHVVCGEQDQAVVSFEKALELDSGLFEALYFYGRVCFQQGRLERALELFESAERAGPEDFQTPILSRQIYRSLGRPDEAMAAARRGVDRAAKHLELNPDDTRALNLGFGGLVDLNEKARAIEWAERSLAIDGDNSDTLYNLACGFAVMGQPLRALDYLEKAGLHGGTIAEWADNDSDLDSLREDPRFQAILAEMKARNHPPPSDA
jgi:TolB-like protein/Flp pilus assembly protein TadD